MIEFIIANIDTISIVATAILAIGGVIVRLTPTTTDDKIFDVFKRGIELIKANVKVEDLTKIKDKIEELKSIK